MNTWAATHSSPVISPWQLISNFHVHSEMDQSYDKDNDKDRGNTCTPILNLQIHFIVIYHRLCHKISMKEYSSFIMLYNKADFKNFFTLFSKVLFHFYCVSGISFRSPQVNKKETVNSCLLESVLHTYSIQYTYLHRVCLVLSGRWVTR